tara:strand:- start:60759 stop:61529 length:771 start_codon:yes stop_codon:yes gene_type:complete
MRGDALLHRLCAITYAQESVAAHCAAELGYRLIDHIHDAATGADAMIFLSSVDVVVAFRGTERNHNDIMTDLKFGRRAFLRNAGGRSIEVHRGFLAQWESIMDRVYASATAAAQGGLNIIATGHSLGGALAMLCAIEWRWITTVVTFGAPRVGDARIREAVELLKVQHRRYVYGGDIVPIVPLMAMGYRHDGRPIYLTRAGKAIANCPLWRELAGRVRSLLTVRWEQGWTWCPVPTRIFTDHRIGNYGVAMAEAAR